MKKYFRYGLRVTIGVIAVLLAVITFNTIRYTAEIRTDIAPFVLGADLDAATTTLAEAIQFETVSTDLTAPDFDGFAGFLSQKFPAVHATMQRKTLAANTLLYKWVGTDPSQAPVLLAAHYDVVPVAADSLADWDYPPFSGTVADGFIWGRGALDNKGALIAILSAAEHLISTGFTPERTIYFSFGGDEEIGGTGAVSVAKFLKEQDIQLAWALDEGSFVLSNVIPGLAVPVASINLSEKGYVTLKLIARAQGGHSSMPPRMTAVGRIARAVDHLQSSPMPGGLDGVSAQFFDNLGPYFPLDKRVLFANSWLFSPLIEGALAGAASTNAMLRTTTAPTMLSGSTKENVLATQATASINFRIHPRDSIADVIAHVTRTVDDPEVEITVDGDHSSEPSPVSSADSQGFHDIEDSILAVYGEVALVPGLTIAGTDARHYALAADDAYRINPFMVENHDIARFHGTNERLSIENLKRGIDFFGALIGRQ